MPQRYVLVLTAPNRVGILASVTTALDELGGDLVEVNESVTQGFFTATIAAEFPSHRQENVIIDHIRDVCRPYALEVTLRNLAQPKIECSDRPSHLAAPKAEEFRQTRQAADAQSALQAGMEESARTMVLRVEGPNIPGVLRTFSTRLAEEQIDITDLHGIDHQIRATFDLVIQLSVPGRIDIDTLGHELEELARSLGVTVSLELLAQPELGITTRTTPWMLTMTH